MMVPTCWLAMDASNTTWLNMHSQVELQRRTSQDTSQINTTEARSQKVVLPVQLEERHLRSALHSQLSRAAPGHLLVCCIWTPSTVPTVDGGSSSCLRRRRAEPWTTQNQQSQPNQHKPHHPLMSYLQQTHDKQTIFIPLPHRLQSRTLGTQTLYHC